MSEQAPTLSQALSAMAAEGDTAPAPGRPSLAVPLSDIPLPPGDLVDQLDNSDVSAAQAAASAEVATLEFIGDDPPERVFQLKYPFRWQGEPVRAITVRQLRTGQLGEVYARIERERRTPELYDFYAEMTGLPASVLRALPAADGEPIIGVAWDFLPPSFRQDPG